MFDFLNGSSITYKNKNYTLVEDIRDHQEDIQDDQKNIEEDQKDIKEDQEDIQEDQEEIQEEVAKNTTDQAVELTDDNSTVVLTAQKTEASMVEEMVGAENLDSSIIIGCSAVGVVCLVALILVVLYCAHSNTDPDLRARQLKGEMLQTDETIAHIFQVLYADVFC